VPASRPTHTLPQKITVTLLNTTIKRLELVPNTIAFIDSLQSAGEPSIPKPAGLGQHVANSGLTMLGTLVDAVLKAPVDTMLAFLPQLLSLFIRTAREIALDPTKFLVQLNMLLFKSSSERTKDWHQGMMILEGCSLLLVYHPFERLQQPLGSLLYNLATLHGDLDVRDQGTFMLVNVCVCVCVCVCVYVCVYIYICVCVCVCLHHHTYACIPSCPTPFLSLPLVHPFLPHRSAHALHAAD
jgi:hypothetical protein